MHRLKTGEMVVPYFMSKSFPILDHWNTNYQVRILLREQALLSLELNTYLAASPRQTCHSMSIDWPAMSCLFLHVLLFIEFSALSFLEYQKHCLHPTHLGLCRRLSLNRHAPFAVSMHPIGSSCIRWFSHSSSVRPSSESCFPKWVNFHRSRCTDGFLGVLNRFNFSNKIWPTVALGGTQEKMFSHTTLAHSSNDTTYFQRVDGRFTALGFVDHDLSLEGGDGIEELTFKWRAQNLCQLPGKMLWEKQWKNQNSSQKERKQKIENVIVRHGRQNFQNCGTSMFIDKYDITGRPVQFHWHTFSDHTALQIKREIKTFLGSTEPWDFRGRTILICVLSDIELRNQALSKNVSKTQKSSRNIQSNSS